MLIGGPRVTATDWLERTYFHRLLHQTLMTGDPVWPQFEVCLVQKTHDYYTYRIPFVEQGQPAAVAQAYLLVERFVDSHSEYQDCAWDLIMFEEADGAISERIVYRQCSDGTRAIWDGTKWRILALHSDRMRRKEAVDSDD